MGPGAGDDDIDEEALVQQFQSKARVILTLAQAGGGASPEMQKRTTFSAWREETRRGKMDALMAEQRERSGRA